MRFLFLRKGKSAIIAQSNVDGAISSNYSSAKRLHYSLFIQFLPPHVRLHICLPLMQGEVPNECEAVGLFQKNVLSPPNNPSVTRKARATFPIREGLDT